MSLWKLVKRGLFFYWRTNLGVLLAAMIATSILTGALVVGDSVRYSLQAMVTARLGSTQFALSSHNRFFRDKLAEELSKELGTEVAPVLFLRGLISDGDNKKRANLIKVLGVDERFFSVGAGQNPSQLRPLRGRVRDWSDGIVLNEPLAAKLAVKVGDQVLLRIENPSAMSRDMALTPVSDLTIAFRLDVKEIAGKSEFGRFSLQANQIAPLNAFVPIQWLQEKLERPGQANLLLVAANRGDNISIEKANEAIKKCWQLADAELEIRHLERQGMLEIRSRRIFIDDFLGESAMRASAGAMGILTYFVNELRFGDRVTPYSMVTAMRYSPDSGGIIPVDMQDDEILVNQWVASDLKVKVGDEIELTYFVVMPTRKLQEQKSKFKVRGIVSLEGPALDPELMPDFPGLADVENCRDWKPGISIDLKKIRPCDEDYWQRYRGTPKAFVTLKAGQDMWANRYGNLTAVRYPSDGESEKIIAERILSSVAPGSVGLFFQPVRELGVKAAGAATDFGWLFLGFSFFLIVAALVLMGLVFVFGVESRSEQVGMLLAMGLPARLVARMMFIEGAILAILGAIVGTLAGLLYTKAMIYGLTTIWRVAVSGSKIYFFAKPSTLFVAAMAAVAVSLIAVWLTLRKQVSYPARELLVGNLKWQFFAAKPVSKGRCWLCVTVMSAAVAVLLLVVLGGGDSGSASLAFFGAGTLLLIAGLGLNAALLSRLSSTCSRPLASLAGLGLRNSTRRIGRSLTVVGLLACGIFLVIAVGANRHNPLAHAHRRDSGTGGFALFGESTIPFPFDLNSSAGRKTLAMDDDELEDVQFVQLRVYEGDDASCFNLNRAQKPRLLGIQPEQLLERRAFSFANTIGGLKEDGWGLLNCNLGQYVVPAIGDYPTIIWALGKSLGDEIEYNDEKGQTFRLRIVGVLKNSILQGSLLIAEDEFIKRFPSQDGYRMFLIDVPEGRTNKVIDKLTDRLKDFGLEITPAYQRLAEFNAVENAYLSIFQLLGGLGLILGSMGLGLVVLRNMLDRRGELAMLRAVGLNKAALKRMVLYEHTGLLISGLGCGIVAAMVAVSPALRSPRADVPYGSLALTIVAIGISGVLWIWLATTIALGGKLLDALRSE